jgi:hypothetical protein
MQTGKDKLSSEDGNVLFLILIAVALFAALSYAVTQSSRSGGGGAQDSTSLIQSSQITQYPASVKTSVLRMQISNGITIGELAFDPPSQNSVQNNAPYAVFESEGGDATYKHRVSVGQNSVGPWRYWYADIEGIGDGDDSVGSPDSNDEIIAVLPGIPSGICEKVNNNFDLPDPSDSGVTLGASGLPSSCTNLTSLDCTISDSNSDGTITNTPGMAEPLGDTSNANTPALTGKAFGCFNNSTDIGGTPYVYYHTLIEQ